MTYMGNNEGNGVIKNYVTSLIRGGKSTSVTQKAFKSQFCCIFKRKFRFFFFNKKYFLSRCPLDICDDNAA